MTSPLKSRRTLIMAAAAGTCAIAAAAGGPAAAFVLAPLGIEGLQGRWVMVLRLEQLKEGEPKRVAIVSERRDAWTLDENVELGSVWLVRRGETVLAFSAVCPHLGCSVNAVGREFACPCHTSAFDADGKKKSGPSPRDMDTLETKITGPLVLVNFRRFRIGVPEKVEA